MKPASIHAIAIAIAAFALAGCQRHAPAPQPSTATAPATAASGTSGPEPEVVATEATLAQSGVQPGADARTRALAGTYTGTLPCADCPGIDETLVLGADGGFVLTDTYRERPGSENIVQGSWSFEDGTRIRLDPGSKEQRDQLYAIDGEDALVALDMDGKRIQGGPDRRLVRGR
jgi:uncharacterized lipoprotein NlpE involved in copper resistance